MRNQLISDISDYNDKLILLKEKQEKLKKELILIEDEIVFFSVSKDKCQETLRKLDRSLISETHRYHS